MSKIVQVINKMILNQEKIGGVQEATGGLLLFIYDEKYRWGVRETDDDFFLMFFNTDLSINKLAQSDYYQNVPCVVYRASELGTKEAFASFRELNQVLKEKILGIDEVIKDILGDGDVPF